MILIWFWVHLLHGWDGYADGLSSIIFLVWNNFFQSAARSWALVVMTFHGLCNHMLTWMSFATCVHHCLFGHFIVVTNPFTCLRLRTKFYFKFTWENTSYLLIQLIWFFSIWILRLYRCWCVFFMCFFFHFYSCYFCTFGLSENHCPILHLTPVWVFFHIFNSSV